MVCKKCYNMLCLQKPRIDSGTLSDLKFTHHVDDKARRDSADGGCYLCRVVSDKIRALDASRVGSLDDNEKQRTSLATLRWIRPKLQQRRQAHLYKLDFSIEGVKKHVASFLLEEVPSQTLGRHAVSSATSSPEVFQLAKSWIEECERHHDTCKPNPNTVYCPTRLLDLENEGIVRLVVPGPHQLRYMTLSHCWGKVNFKKLTHENFEDFRQGVSVETLPQTFQDAIKFTRELEVRWLWIDALCIIQYDKDDWLEQSKQMHDVYTYSYCNISATAAVDSSKGLFNIRDPDTTWIGGATLTMDGLREGATGRVYCTIHDLSFWQDMIVDAPVNNRAWVLQERLLAPRIVHFCKDQIAFECRKADRAECRPDGVSHYQVKNRNVIGETRFKSIDLETGKRLRELRLNPEQFSSLPFMSEGLDQKFYFYEIWKRLIEIYSKMELSHPEDRLIALSGVAKMMTKELKSDEFEDEYIAGMWAMHMASQLLWYVNEGEGQARQPYVKTRLEKEEYRAPSWSWASVETTRGITFPETKSNDLATETTDGLLITVEVMRLIYRKRDNMYGLLTDGYLVLRGVLRKIELIDELDEKSAEPVDDKISDEAEVDKSVDSAARWPEWMSSGPSAYWVVGVIWAFCMLLFPIRLNLNISSSYHLKQSHVAMIWWTIFCAVCALSIIGFRLVLDQKASMQTSSEYPHLNVKVDGQEQEKSNVQEHEGKNRYKWCLVKDGVRVNPMQEVVFLDSPASEPCIFGPNAAVFCLPAAKDKDYLVCLLLQAVMGGDYGVRYRRIGLAKVLKVVDDVQDIINPPGNGDLSLGKYSYGEGPRTAGDSTICII